MSSSNTNTSLLSLSWKNRISSITAVPPQRSPNHIRIQDIQFHIVRKLISFHSQLLLINSDTSWHLSFLVSLEIDHSCFFSCAVASTTTIVTLSTASYSTFRYVCAARVSDPTDGRLFLTQKRVISTEIGPLQHRTWNRLHTKSHIMNFFSVVTLLLQFSRVDRSWKTLSQ